VPIFGWTSGGFFHWKERLGIILQGAFFNTARHAIQPFFPNTL